MTNESGVVALPLARDHNTLILQIKIIDRSFSGKMTQWSLLRQDPAVHHNRLRLSGRIGCDQRHRKAGRELGRSRQKRRARQRREERREATLFEWVGIHEGMGLEVVVVGVWCWLLL